MMKIPFSPPDMTEREIEGAVDAIRSGWITTGPKTKQLERRIADYCGVDTAVCLNSQTACAEMALRLLGIGAQNGGSALDEVIVPAYTYTATASVVCHAGARLVLIDCRKDSLEMDYDAVEKAVSPRTKAIIPVDLGGVPCDYDRLFSIVEGKKRLFTPESELQKTLGRVAVCTDAAHAFGAKRRGRMVGSIGDMSSFSFHAVKNLTTAEGGALTWNIPGADSRELYRMAQLYSLHGQSKDALAKTQAGGWEYDVLGPWYKCNMTDIMAGIGLSELDRYGDILERRREIIGRYDAAFRPLGVSVLPHYTGRHTSSGHLYITRIPGIGAGQRQQIIEQMAQAGIATNVHYKPLPMLTAYKRMGFDIREFPNAYRQFENEITLPLHTRLTDEEVGYVIDRFSDCVRRI